MTDTGSVRIRRNPARRCKRVREASCIDRGQRNAKRLRGSLRVEPVKSYFDDLPSDTVENILRFTSVKPLCSEWEKYLEAETVLSLIESHDAFGVCARRVCRAVDACVEGPSERRGVLVTGGGTASRLLFPRLMRALGNRVSGLRVRRSQLPQGWVNAMGENAVHLRKLALVVPNLMCRYPLEEVLEPVQGHLEDIELSWGVLTAPQIAVIARFCGGIKRLLIRFQEVWGELGPIWSGIGETVEEISWESENIFVADEAILGLGVMAKHCVVLKKIGFEMFGMELRDFVVDFVKEIGTRLDMVKFEWCGIGTRDVEKIVAACPNVRVDVLEQGGLTRDTLVALGGQAERVTIGGRSFEQEGNDCDWDRVGDACVNIRKMDIEWVRFVEDDLNGLFRRRKERLIDLSVMYMRARYAERVLRVVSERVDTLEEFRFKGPLPAMEILEAFAKSNRRLKVVKFFNMMPTTLCPCIRYEEEEIGSSWTSEVVDVFLKCSSMREIVVSCTLSSGMRYSRWVPVFEKVGRAAWRKGVSAFLCGYRYA